MSDFRKTPLPSDRRGVATIEFALLTCFLFGIMLAALDFGMFFIQRSNLGSGVAASAVYSFNNRTVVPFANIPAMVTAVAGAPGATNLVVTTECNGGTTSCVNQNRQCACLSPTGSFTAAGTCGEPCSDGQSTSGFYLKVKARYQYVPTVVPASVFGDTTLEQAAVVRLQ
ncbi:hypothetical protein DMC47_20645 [Nostoc sp. 3335mG]|nr:hypothetical protein DMC47_20645 [Nostoc sp. 3335mG]